MNWFKGKSLLRLLLAKWCTLNLSKVTGLPTIWKVPWAYKFPGKDYYEVESEFVLTVTLHKETGIKPGIYYDAYFTLGDEKFRARRIKVMIEE